MQKPLPLLVLSSLLAVGCNSSADVFPELMLCEEAPDGYQLTFRDGPDFYVWAVDPKPVSDEQASAILYFGTAPSREGLHSSVIVLGDLAKQATFWSVWGLEGEQFTEAVVDYKHDEDSLLLTLHAIVSSAEEKDLLFLRGWLSSVTFCQREIVK